MEFVEHQSQYKVRRKYPDDMAEKDNSNFNSVISADRSWLVVRYLQRSMTDHTSPMQSEEHADDTPTVTDDTNQQTAIVRNSDVQFVPTWDSHMMKDI